MRDEDEENGKAHKNIIHYSDKNNILFLFVQGVVQTKEIFSKEAMICNNPFDFG